MSRIDNPTVVIWIFLSFANKTIDRTSMDRALADTSWSPKEGSTTPILVGGRYYGNVTDFTNK